MSAPRLSKPEAVPVTLRMWMRKNKLATMVIISLSLLLALSQAQVQHEVNHAIANTPKIGFDTATETSHPANPFTAATSLSQL